MRFDPPSGQRCYFITFDGQQGAISSTFTGALRCYAKALKIAGKQWAYRGKQR